MTSDYLRVEKKKILNLISREMAVKKLGKAEVARSLGVTKAYITSLLNLRSQASLERLIEIAHSLGIDIKINYSNEKK